MKTLRTFIFVALASLFALGLTGCVTPYSTTAVVRTQYVNPEWAPPYDEGVRYYYFPDIEVYYDLINRDYVYLYNGHWYFSRVLPSIYAGFDLYNGFVISLNINVYQPWRHHQYYISHYPRYYYRNYYRNYDPQRMRGFNENKKTPHYRGNYKPDKYEQDQYKGGRRSDQYQRDTRTTSPRQQGTERRNQEQNNRGRQDQYQRNEKDQTPRSTGNEGRGQDQNRGRQDQYQRNERDQTPRSSGNEGQSQDKNIRGRSDQNQQNNNVRSTDNENNDRKIESTREPQNPNYYGPKIGKPVKVERQMREQRVKETRPQPQSRSESKSENKSDNKSDKQQQRGRR